MPGKYFPLAERESREFVVAISFAILHNNNHMISTIVHMYVCTQSEVSMKASAVPSLMTISNVSSVCLNMQIRTNCPTFDMDKKYLQRWNYF